MHKMKRTIAVSMSILFVLSATLIPGQALAVSELDDKEYYNVLIEQSKQEFIDTVTTICANETSPWLIVAAVAMSDRDDISEDDLVSIIVDERNPNLLRRIAIESYSAKSPEIVDEAVIEMMIEESENASLRTLAIALLSDFLKKEDAYILVSASASNNENLAYNAIKALERVDAKRAVRVASEIYEKYTNETPARINIAAKVLSRALSNNTSVARQNGLNQNAFIEKSMEIYNSTVNEEIRYAIGQSVNRISKAEVETLPIAPRATGYEGYAAYRDGVVLGEWHAGIVYTNESEYILAHAPGGDDPTEFVNYRDFIDGNDSMGCYRPFATLTTSKRDSVCRTAADLVGERIEYILTDPIRYSTASTATSKYPASDIIAIRCDGFVEYSYEYNNVQVFGNSDYWNIASVDPRAEIEHSGFQMTPKKQAEDYMEYVGIF